MGGNGHVGRCVCGEGGGGTSHFIFFAKSAESGRHVFLTSQSIATDQSESCFSVTL